MWEVELKTYSLYRGTLAHPVISKMGNEWVVFMGSTPNVKDKTINPWKVNGNLNAVNCGQSLFKALYCWMCFMDSYGWIVEERQPSIKIWNEFEDIEKQGEHIEHRRGKSYNLLDTLLYTLYINVAKLDRQNDES